LAFAAELGLTAVVGASPLSSASGPAFSRSHSYSCTCRTSGGKRLRTAKQTLARANFRLRKIGRAYSRVKRGRVISQKPEFGAVLPGGSKVSLVVSRGGHS
jgi:PASTA domain